MVYAEVLSFACGVFGIVEKIISIFARYNVLTMVLEDIAQDFIPGITKAKASFLAECAIACLSRCGHESGVEMVCKGLIDTPEPLIWNTPYDDQLQRSTEDTQEATEHGAECVSVQFAIEHTPYTIVRRSRKKTGVDYWLGMKDDPLFTNAARLEISGILDNFEELDKRKKQKLLQTSQSDSTMLPAFVSIVEFGTPAIAFVEK